MLKPTHRHDLYVTHALKTPRWRTATQFTDYRPTFSAATEAKVIFVLLPLRLPRAENVMCLMHFLTKVLPSQHTHKLRTNSKPSNINSQLTDSI